MKSKRPTSIVKKRQFLFLIVVVSVIIFVVAVLVMNIQNSAEPMPYKGEYLVETDPNQPSDIPVTQPSSRKGWNTYTINYRSLSVDYPDYGELKDVSYGSDGRQLSNISYGPDGRKTNVDDESFLFTIEWKQFSKYPDAKSASDVFDRYLSETYDSYKSLDGWFGNVEKTYLLNGNTAVIYYHPGSQNPTKRIIVGNGDYAYSISVPYSYNGTYTDYLKNADAILQSVRFIDSK